MKLVALHGRDPKAGIVGITPNGDFVTLAIAAGEERRSETDRFRPFLLCRDPADLGATAGSADLECLAGDGELRWLAQFASWTDFRAAADHLTQPHRQAKAGSGPRASIGLGPDCIVLPDPIVQYLVASGRTFGKGMNFADLRRLTLDIETYCAAGHNFSDARRPTDRIIAVSLRLSDGREALLWGKDLAEDALLAELARLIRGWDPDILEGHNLARFDLPYLETRARQFGAVLAWGRGGETATRQRTRIDLGDRSLSTWRWTVPGRGVVDTWELAQLYDHAHYDLPGYGLKKIARHFGIAPADRTYVEGDRIAWTYDHEPERLARYALDDARETSALSALLLTPYFAQARSVPLAIADAATMGGVAKIDLMMLREYLRQGIAPPARPAVRRQASGPTAQVFARGVFAPVARADAAALHLSILREEALRPRGDSLGVFAFLLASFTDLSPFAEEDALSGVSGCGDGGRGVAPARDLAGRVAVRRGGRRQDPPAGCTVGPGPETAADEATLRANRALLHSFCSYLGSSSARFADAELSTRVATRGRQLLATMADWLAARGARPIQADAGGMYFVPPAGQFDEGGGSSGPDGAGLRSLVAEFAATLPSGIHCGRTAAFAAMFSFKAKNHALRTVTGRVILRGSALRCAGLDPSLRRLVRQTVTAILESKPEGAWGFYGELRRPIGAAATAEIGELRKTMRRFLEFLPPPPAEFPEFRADTEEADVQGCLF